MVGLMEATGGAVVAAYSLERLGASAGANGAGNRGGEAGSVTPTGYVFAVSGTTHLGHVLVKHGFFTDNSLVALSLANDVLHTGLFGVHSFVTGSLNHDVLNNRLSDEFLGGFVQLPGVVNVAGGSGHLLALLDTEVALLGFVVVVDDVVLLLVLNSVMIADLFVNHGEVLIYNLSGVSNIRFELGDGARNRLAEDPFFDSLGYHGQGLDDSLDAGLDHGPFDGLDDGPLDGLDDGPLRGDNVGSGPATVLAVLSMTVATVAAETRRARGTLEATSTDTDFSKLRRVPK